MPSQDSGSGLEPFERPVAGDTVREVFRHQRSLVAGGAESNATRRVSIGAARISTVAAWERDQEAKRDSPSSEDFADELSDLVVAVLARPLVSATVVPARA